MKEGIEQAVLEMIKKSGVELGEGELESIIDASFKGFEVQRNRNVR